VGGLSVGQQRHDAAAPREERHATKAAGRNKRAT
jgi:hypothetical protein